MANYIDVKIMAESTIPEDYVFSRVDTLSGCAVYVQRAIAEGDLDDTIEFHPIRPNFVRRFIDWLLWEIHQWFDGREL